MQTSAEWWAATKQDETKLNSWLQKQFTGEWTASDRIQRYCVGHAPPDWVPVLEKIAEQERQHAMWVLELMTNRGVLPAPITHEARYWEETLAQIVDFESATAVAAHAEVMRLERIEVIAADGDAPQDIRETFQRILKEELFHAQAFKAMAGRPALKAAAEAHERGVEMLGLITVAETL